MAQPQPKPKFAKNERVQLVLDREVAGVVVDHRDDGSYLVDLGPLGIHPRREYDLEPWLSMEEERNRAEDEVRNQEAIAEKAVADRDRVERGLLAIERMMARFGIPASSPIVDTFTSILSEMEEIESIVRELVTPESKDPSPALVRARQWLAERPKGTDA